ncbi:hypothetical protein SAMN05421823_102396 [Catalinimonas alkaloidigena]|uniref:DUF5668 domain-containing protein n=1 Tax=Catalinimonas alkaloidigena TaxID=1075417 RepID=A0A1G9AS63_9BACT|nr:hypothetical protein [Catalinimonas alkaloidigena]SDK30168.1 hypothetical protein SAMN05421823_102396 [Catalinimonas alkaloidigena]
MKYLELNAIQSISVTGVITSVMAQGFLYLFDKTVDQFWALYPSWVAIFLIGTLVRVYRGKHLDHHHH